MGRHSYKGTEKETQQVQVRLKKTELAEVKDSDHYGHKDMSAFLRWCWDLGRKKAEKARRRADEG